MPSAAATKKDGRRGPRPPVPPAPPQRVEGGVAWLSIDEAARRLEITASMVHRVVRERGLVSRMWRVERSVGGGRRRVRYVTLVSVNLYRERRDAWKALHGQT